MDAARLGRDDIKERSGSRRRGRIEARRLVVQNRTLGSDAGLERLGVDDVFTRS